MDPNGNNRLTAKELFAREKLKDEKLANGVFKALDTNEDGELVIPEYLRVWAVGPGIEPFVCINHDGKTFSKRQG